MNNNILEVKGISYNIKNNIKLDYKLIDNISFVLPNNKIKSFLAPFGSGKSTLLKIIAKNGVKNSENIKYNGNKIFYIPQYPIAVNGLSVQDNINFYNSNISNETVLNLIQKVGLEGYEDHVPVQKSLGFLFRIALAIGLSFNSDLFIIDDTLLEMKGETKIEIMDLIRELKIKENISVLYGTSNFNDAIVFGDEIVIAKANPLSLIIDEEITNEKISTVAKLRNNEFLSKKQILEEKIKTNNLNNLII